MERGGQNRLLAGHLLTRQDAVPACSGLATGIYATNSPEACQYVMENADCNIVVVENDAQLQKILTVRDQLPHLKAIVQYKGQPRNGVSGCISVSRLSLLLLLLLLMMMMIMQLVMVCRPMYILSVDSAFAVV